jgi:hypothetical protein
MAKFKVFGVVVLLSVLMLSLNGCVSVYKYNVSGQHDNVAVAVKDFEPKGMVFVTTSILKGSLPFQPDDGEKVTYELLLKEAQKVGADAIVNVTMNVETDRLTLFRVIPWGQKTETWTGSALAIAYTESVGVPREGDNQTELEPSRRMFKLFGLIPIPFLFF